MINAGDFNKRVFIIDKVETENENGFKQTAEVIIAKAWAKVNTTKGFTLVTNGSDFENVTTRLLIRTPQVDISRKYLVKMGERYFKIRYVNNIDEAGKFTELQVEGVRQNG